MPVQKFRSAADMPRVPRLKRLDEAALRRIAALWAFSSLVSRAASRVYPRGVFRYRSVEEAQAARRALASENIRRLRDERERKVR